MPNNYRREFQMKKILALALTLVMAIGFCASAQATTYLALGTGGTSGT